MEKKNFYDWLEINRNASPEVIEKAYKTLVRKYHPDLQEESQRAASEEILKLINDAYDTLSDPIKKADYDANLVDDSISADEYQNLYEEKSNLENELNNLRANQTTPRNEYAPPISSSPNEPPIYSQNPIEPNVEEQIQYEQQMNQAVEKAYHDAYIQDLKRRGFKIRYKKTGKDYLRIFITVLVILLLIFLISKIPFTRNYFISLYEENDLIHWFVDIFSNLFHSIASIFKK